MDAQMASQTEKLDYTKRMTKYPPPPPSPDDSEVFLDLQSRKPNASFLRRFLHREGRLKHHQALEILRQGTLLLQKEQTVLTVPAPVTMVGDIHGQYYDLLTLMDPAIGGSASKTRYLFLGDYVDRGCFGIECLLLLFALKINYPDNFLFLRGNHESRHLTDYFTFRLECKRKYSEVIYEAAVQSFNAMPLAAIVDNKFFCVHGGLSPELHTIEDIMRLNRFCEPPTSGLMCDLLWADPAPEDFDSEFANNPTRGCSYTFGHKAVDRFLKRNHLTLVIRAHEAQSEGYRQYQKNGKHYLMTLFSAPNYLDYHKNLGAIAVWNGSAMSIRQFKHSAHPYWLPNFADAFSWSLPFVATMATEMLRGLFYVFGSEELDSDWTDEMDVSDTENDVDPRKALQEANMPAGQRVTGLSKVVVRKRQLHQTRKMLDIYQLLREQSESGSELRMPVSEEEDRRASTLDLALRAGNSESATDWTFEDIRRMDMINEQLPPPLLELQQAALEYRTSPGSSLATLTDEPEGMPEDKAGVLRAPVPRVGRIIGTTGSSNPSTRRRTLEEIDRAIKRLSGMKVSE